MSSRSSRSRPSDHDRHSGSVTCVMTRPLSSPFSDRLSSRARAFLEREGVFRDVSRSCDWETLAAELERLGAPWFDAVFDIEESFGGLVKRSGERRGQPELAVGLYQMIALTPQEQQLTELPGYSSATLMPRPWPRIMHARLGVELMLVGCYVDESHLYVEDGGRIWVHVGLINKIEAAAGSMQVFLERLAFEAEMRSLISDFAAVSLGADLAHELARDFSLHRDEEASDSVVSNWRSSSIWVQRLGSPVPGETKTLVVASSPLQMVAVVERAIQIDSNVRVAVDTYRPGGPARLTALLKAGIPAEG